MGNHTIDCDECGGDLRGLGGGHAYGCSGGQDNPGWDGVKLWDRTPEIDLYEFARQERARLEAFIRHWEVNLRDNPDHYPAKLAPGDWDDQLDSFRELET